MLSKLNHAVNWQGTDTHPPKERHLEELNFCVVPSFPNEVSVGPCLLFEIERTSSVQVEDASGTVYRGGGGSVTSPDSVPSALRPDGENAMGRAIPFKAKQLFIGVVCFPLQKAVQEETA